MYFVIADIRSVPHVTNAIKDWIRRVASVPVDGSDDEPDVCIIELGGTVGDIESMPFVEALTQLRHEAGSTNFMTIHVSYVPTIHGEQKTKPTQHAVKSVRSYGLVPDLVRIKFCPFERGKCTDRIFRSPAVAKLLSQIARLLSSHCTARWRSTKFS